MPRLRVWACFSSIAVAYSQFSRRKTVSLSFLKKSIALFGLVAAAAAYAASPHYSDMKLSDEEDGSPMEAFAPDTDKIFLHAGLIDTPAGTKLTSTWIAEDTNGVAPANYKIDSVDLTVAPPINVATFSLSKPTSGWPVGSYRVDLFIDGKAAGTMHFKVEKD
jgi:hypothetical protein